MAHILHFRKTARSFRWYFHVLKRPKVVDKRHQKRPTFSMTTKEKQDAPRPKDTNLVHLLSQDAELEEGLLNSQSEDGDNWTGWTVLRYYVTFVLAMKM